MGFRVRLGLKLGPGADDRREALSFIDVLTGTSSTGVTHVVRQVRRRRDIDVGNKSQ